MFAEDISGQVSAYRGEGVPNEVVDSIAARLGGSERNASLAGGADGREGHRARADLGGACVRPVRGKYEPARPAEV